MTVQSTPFAIQTGGETAALARRLSYATWGARSGILRSGDLAVTQKSTPNMSVDVAGGQVIILGTEATYQGAYFGENQGTQNVTVTAAHATLARKDLIVARIRDAEYSGSTNTFSIEVVTGTPAGSPADPSLPSGSVFVLARVDVAAAAATITNANITDLRTTYSSSQYGLATAAGGTIICTSTTRPASPYEGLSIYETDTDTTHFYNGSAWVQVSHLGQWTGFTPTITQSVTPTKTVNYARYIRNGRTITGSITCTLTSAGTASNIITYSLPVTAANANVMVGSGKIYDSSANTTYVGSIETNTVSSIAMSIQGSNNYAGASIFTAGLASGDVVYMSFVYEAAS